MNEIPVSNGNEARKNETVLNRLEAVVMIVQHELPLEVADIEIITWLTREPCLAIRYKQKNTNISSTEDFYKKLKAILAENNLELGRQTSTDTFVITEPITGGGTNWRRWIWYPEALSTEVQAILDRVANTVGQQEGMDNFEKYSRYYHEALRRGLITQDECRAIEKEIYRAAHGTH